MRARRGGCGVHLPDESDGHWVAGTRRSRVGHRDMGILKGNVGSRGESSEFKTQQGASCGAPAQDHYSYEKSKEVTDMEFPPGKKAWLSL